MNEKKKKRNNKMFKSERNQACSTFVIKIKRRYYVCREKYEMYKSGQQYPHKKRTASIIHLNEKKYIEWSDRLKFSLH